MNRIIVAIDFSDCSINAFAHAVSLAQKTNSDITLVWVQKSAVEKDKFDSVNDRTREVNEHFEQLIAKYKPELPDNKITYKIRTGKVYKEVTDEARESKAMLIVAGTHGASVLMEFWIGSNAIRIISLAPCPVITIREGINIGRPLKKIVMPIDSTLETRQKATFTGYLAKMYDAEVFILSLYTSKVKEVRQNVDLYARQVALHFNNEGVKHTIDSVEADNISEAMINYANKIDANLIAIMKDQESSTSNLWMGPYTQQTVNHSPIPVLVVNSKETLAAGLGF